MSKPVIFTISATWDDDASVWSGHCDEIPAAADAPTLDELLAKISTMAPDLLPDNHPGIDPADLFLQITALKGLSAPQWGGGGALEGASGVSRVSTVFASGLTIGAAG
jgi:hypothetical protein